MKFLIETTTKQIGMWGAGISEDIPAGYIEVNLDSDEYTTAAFNSYRNKVESNQYDPADSDFDPDINVWFVYNEATNTVQAKSEYEIAQAYAYNLIWDLDRTNAAYIKSRYSLERQITFLTLKIDAMLANRSDIITELDKIKEWCYSYPLAYFYTKEQEINDLVDAIGRHEATLEDLKNHRATWNFEQFDDFDYNLHIKDIMVMFNNPPE